MSKLPKLLKYSKYLRPSKYLKPHQLRCGSMSDTLRKVCCQNEIPSKDMLVARLTLVSGTVCRMSPLESFSVSPILTRHLSQIASYAVDKTVDRDDLSAFSTLGINRDLIKCFLGFFGVFFMLFDDFMHAEESAALAVLGTECELES